MRDVTTIPPIPADRRVAYGQDDNQFIDLFDPDVSPRPATVLMIHGGFWRARYDLTHASHLCAALAKCGLSVGNVEYRRVGNFGGGWPGSFQDVAAASDVARELYPDNALIMCGHSAGGHLALRLACDQKDLAGVVALAPVAALRAAYDLHLSNDAVVEFIGGSPSQLPAEYDEACPSKHSLQSPAILIHGADDDVVPISVSREYMRVRKGDPAHLIELPGVGHMELIDPEEACFETIVAAINDLLR